MSVDPRPLPRSWLEYATARDFDFGRYRDLWIEWCAKGRAGERGPPPKELVAMSKRRNELVTNFHGGK